MANTKGYGHGVDSGVARVAGVVRGRRGSGVWCAEVKRLAPAGTIEPHRPIAGQDAATLSGETIVEKSIPPRIRMCLGAARRASL